MDLCWIKFLNINIKRDLIFTLFKGKRLKNSRRFAHSHNYAIPVISFNLKTKKKEGKDYVRRRVRR